MGTILCLLHDEKFVSNGLFRHHADGMTVEVKDEEFSFIICVSHMDTVCQASRDPKLHEKMLYKGIIEWLGNPLLWRQLLGGI